MTIIIIIITLIVYSTIIITVLLLSQEIQKKHVNFYINYSKWLVL